mmetsp:Transcript_118623/g.193139  ORF Transcript_118623/g.193139 Transcript_118623/m.193139 type:complete len:97 (-) Transcript_118623:16-306(-)
MIVGMPNKNHMPLKHCIKGEMRRPAKLTASTEEAPQTMPMHTIIWTRHSSSTAVSSEQPPSAPGAAAMTPIGEKSVVWEVRYQNQSVGVYGYSLSH